MSPERVHLTIDGIGPRDALVARAVPGAAELVLVDGPGAAATPARFLHGRRCRVRPAGVPAPAAVVEGTVLAVRDAGGHVRDGVVHLVLAGAPADGRRAHDRVGVVRPVTVVPERFGAGWLAARTRDLSPGGVLLEGLADPRPGERLRLLVELAAGLPLDASGRVVRTAADGLTGVRLDPLPAVQMRRLARHLELRRQGELAARRAADAR